MNLQQVLEHIKADELAALESESAEKKRLEEHILNRLLEIGVAVTDGWQVKSNFPQSTSVHVSHPGLRNTVTVWLDYDYHNPLRVSIVDEESDTGLVDIVQLAKLMDREHAPPAPPVEHTPHFCPILSSQGLVMRDCFENKCAWWVRDNNNYHCAIVDIAKYVADSTGV